MTSASVTTRASTGTRVCHTSLGAWRHVAGVAGIPSIAGFALALVLLAAAWLLVAPSNALALTSAEAQPRALDYLHAQLRDNGGFATNSPTGDLATTPWAIMAISAAGYDPGSWSSAAGDIVTALRDMDIEHEAAQGAGSNNTPAFYAKLILAFLAAGRPDLAVEAGRPVVNLAEQLLDYRHSETGHFSLSTSNPGVADTSTTTWAVLALAALGAHEDVVEQAAVWLKGAQGEDGGFSFQSGAIEDVDDTGAAIQALLAAGVPRDDPTVQAAVEFLRQHQNQDGGFVSWVTDTKSTAESTAWALQALNALGEDPADWSRDTDPVGYLLSLQETQGAFAHRAGQLATPLMTTTQVIIALAGRSFPFSLGAHTTAPDYRPTLTSVFPAADATVPSTGFTATAVATDGPGGSGINPASLKVLLDGTALSIDQTAAAQGTLSAQTGTLTPGPHRVSFTFGDHAGHLMTVDATVTVPTPPPSSSTTTTTTRPTTTTTRPATTRTQTTWYGGPSSGPYGGSSTGRTGSGTGGTSVTGRTPTTRAATRTTNASTGRTASTVPGSVSSAAQDATGAPGSIVGTRMESTGATDPMSGGDGRRGDISGAVVPESAGSRGGGWGTGLLAGGIVALMPLGAGLSLVTYRRRSSLLFDAFPAKALDGIPDPTSPPRPGHGRGRVSTPPAPAGSNTGGVEVDRAAWVSFQGRVRYHLGALPLPDEGSAPFVRSPFTRSLSTRSPFTLRRSR